MNQIRCVTCKPLASVWKVQWVTWLWFATQFYLATGTSTEVDDMQATCKCLKGTQINLNNQLSLYSKGQNYILSMKKESSRGMQVTCKWLSSDLQHMNLNKNMPLKTSICPQVYYKTQPIWVDLRQSIQKHFTLAICKSPMPDTFWDIDKKRGKKCPVNASR